jgi:hypothetical protein
MGNELILREQTQALAETKRLNYEITVPQNGKKIELQRGIDFEKIPGTKQPSLTKAGCLRIAKEGYGLCIEPIIEHAIETLDPFPYFFYRARVNLYTYTPNGEKVIVSSGVGSANSAERRNGSKGAHDAANTALKFAEKRAASDAVINLTGLSNIFVQDMDNENFTEKGYEEIKKMNSDDAIITAKQVKRLWAVGEDAGLNVEEIKTVIIANGYPSTKEITQKDYDKIIKALQEKGKK